VSLEKRKKKSPKIFLNRKEHAGFPRSGLLDIVSPFSYIRFILGQALSILSLWLGGESRNTFAALLSLDRIFMSDMGMSIGHDKFFLCN